MVFRLGSAIAFLCQISARFWGMIKGAFVAFQANAAETGFHLIMFPLACGLHHKFGAIEGGPPRNIVTLTTRAGEQTLTLLVLLDSLLLRSLVVVPAGWGAAVVALLLGHDRLLSFLEEIECFSLFTKEILFNQHNLQFGAEKFNQKGGLLCQTVVTVNNF